MRTHRWPYGPFLALNCNWFSVDLRNSDVRCGSTRKVFVACCEFISLHHYNNFFYFRPSVRLFVPLVRPSLRLFVYRWCSRTKKMIIDDRYFFHESSAATKLLYKSVCPSVRWSVGMSRFCLTAYYGLFRYVLASLHVDLSIRPSICHAFAKNR